MVNSDQKRRANFSSMTDSVPFFSARLIFLRLMFRKETESWPVAWWYSIVCLLFRISPLEYSAFDLRVVPALQRIRRQRCSVTTITHLPHSLAPFLSRSNIYSYTFFI